MQNINGLPVSFKGVVGYELVDINTGEVLKRHEQPNLWLDQGTKNLCFYNGTQSYNGAYKLQYLFISASTMTPVVTTSSVPPSDVQLESTKTYEPESKRFKFSAQFAPPVTGTRTTNIIGLNEWTILSQTKTNNNLPYCMTKLSDPIVQDETTSLNVYYYVYIIIPKGFIGFSKNHIDKILNTNWLFKRPIATPPAKTLSDFPGMLYGFAYNPSTEDNMAVMENIYTPLYMKFLPSNNSVSSVQDRSRYKYYAMIDDIGTSSSLSEMSSYRWSGIRSHWSSTDSGPSPIAPFKGVHIGRTCPKSKASSSSFFDTDEGMEAKGFWKALCHRIKPGTISFPFWSAYLYQEVIASGDLSTGQYIPKVSYPEFIATYNLTASGSSANYTIKCRGLELIEKFGRKFFAIGTSFSISDPNNTCDLRTLNLYDIESKILMKIGSSNIPYYIIWDNLLPKNLLTVQYESIGNIIEKFSWSDENDRYSKLEESSLYSAPHSISHAIVINAGDEIAPYPKALLYYGANRKFGLFDPQTDIFEDSWLDFNKMALNESGSSVSFGYYDDGKKYLFLASRYGIYAIGLLGAEINQYSGIGFTEQNFRKIWSNINAPSGAYLGFEDNNLIFAPAKIMAPFSANVLDCMKASHVVKDGAFSFEVDISEFKTFSKDQFGGIAISELNTTENGKFISFTANQDTFGNMKENFETASIIDGSIQNNPTLNFELSGTSNNGAWTIATDQQASGTFSLKTGTNIVANSTATIAITTIKDIPYTINRFGFQYRLYVNSVAVSAHSKIDIFVNGSLVETISSGASDTRWKSFIYKNNDIDININSITIIYTSGTSASGGYLGHFDDFWFTSAEENIIENVNSFGVTGWTNTGESYSDKLSNYMALDNLQTSGFLRIERDIDNLIKTYYKSNELDEWAEINSDTYSLAGPVKVSIFNSLNEILIIGKALKVRNIKYDFFGDCDFDRRIFFSATPVYRRRYYDDIHYSPNAPISGAAVTSRLGTMLDHDGKIHVLRNGYIDYFDNNTFDYTGTTEELLTPEFTSGYMDVDRSTGIAQAILYLSNKSTISRLGASALIEDWFTYDIVSKKWVSRSPNTTLYNAIKLWPDKTCSLIIHDILNSNSQLRIAGWLQFEWSEELQKGILCRINKPNDERAGFPASQEWRDIHPYINGIQVRSYEDPTYPLTTFDTNDKYSVVANQDGISKDNFQILKGLEYHSYYCNTERVVEDINITGIDIDLSVKTNPNLLLVDTEFPSLYSAQLFDTNGDLAYFNTTSPVINEASIINIISPTKIKISHDSLSLAYNAYKDLYVSFNGEFRKIIEYDDVLHIIEIDSTFTVAPINGDLVSIVSPLVMYKVTAGSEEPNSFSINETLGTIKLHSSDIGKNLKINYLALLRSW